MLLSRGLTFSHSEPPPAAVSLATGHRSNLINSASLSPVVQQKWGQAAPPLPVRLCAKLLLSCRSALGGPVFLSFPLLPPHPPPPPIANAQKRQRSPFPEQDWKTSNPPLTLPSFQILAEITGDFFSSLTYPSHWPLSELFSSLKHYQIHYVGKTRQKKLNSIVRYL